MSKIVIIGAGFSGLSAACYLSKAGHEVHVYEKNAVPGGRARQLKTDNGYIFDMGPSWYWMPDVFERFFADFGFQVSDYYDLSLLDPSFEIVFKNGIATGIPASYDKLRQLFESLEKGSAAQLDRFMEEARFKYETGMGEIVHKPGISVTEFADINLIRSAMRLQVFSSFSKHLQSYFKHPFLLALMEFPVLFLGAMPQETPALYSLMNYAGLKLGTWYPKGGFGRVIQSMVEIAEIYGCTIHYNSEVDSIQIAGSNIHGIEVDGETISCDALIAACDYNHTEQELLPPSYRNYSSAYWSKKTFAPSCLIYYLGLKKKIESIEHHTLFFDEELTTHSKEIYHTPKWPSKPLFYVCCPSRSDSTVAPEGHENLFLLMPIAAGLEDNEALRESYFQNMMQRLEKHTGESLAEFIDYKQSYCVNDFITDYNSYKGNAYGLANTLRQTAVLKPKIRNKKLPNLFYAGQLTVPGPGVPPALISGKIAANQLTKYLNKRTHEVAI